MELLEKSLFFGVAISLLGYMVGVYIQSKLPYPIFNPMLIGSVFVIVVLGVFKIDYEVYKKGANYLSYFLTPATVCLAIPLYKQISLLKKNVVAIFGGILAGTLGHLVTIVLLGAFLRLDSKIIISALSKSVTMPIALGISGEVGGIEAVTIVGVTIAGLIGAIFGPFILKVFKIQEPIAQGLAIGTASHAMGTSKMVEVGQVQAAMSSVAIVITGLLTVILVPIYLSI